MPRLSKPTKSDGLYELKTQVQRIVDSPLREVGQVLLSAVADLELVAVDGSRQITIPALIKDLEAVLGHLPRAFSERFKFDTGMVQATIEELGQGGVRLNTMIIPRPGNTWLHGTLPLPWIKGEEQKFVHFIFFQGGDTLREVNLLTYPFFIHEIGHNLLQRYDPTLRQRFVPQLDQLTNRLRLLALADTGGERTKTQRRIEDIRTYWSPTPDHKNWMHELSIDIIALWLCGPAYLATFQDEMEEPEVKPFQITQEHPPNVVRAAALSEVGDSLGWGEFTEGLSKLVNDWRTTRKGVQETDYNQYLELADPLIVQACVSSALAMCEELKLPKCTTALIDRIREIISRGETPDFGIELIVAAWLVRHEQGEDAYLQWEPLVTRDLLQYVIL